MRADERGIALPLAVFALVVIGALVAGVFFAGRLEQRTGQNMVYLAEATQAAEAGTQWVLGNWNKQSYNAMPVGTEITFADQTLGGRAHYQPSFRRLTKTLYLVRSTGDTRDAGGQPLARQQVGLLARLVSFNFDLAAGLTVEGGPVSVRGKSSVNGFDQAPTGWTDCPPLDDAAGVVYSGTLDKKGGPKIEGDPPEVFDSTLNMDKTLGNYGLDQLKELATLILSSGNYSSIAPAVKGTPAVCDEAVETNWGAPDLIITPAHPCFDYFPIVYRNGPLHISGNGVGQGILLVEGDLEVSGSFSFYGPVIVLGSLKLTGTSGSDAKFYGGIYAKTVDASKLSGNASIQYSTCAIKRALDQNADLVPLGERSWLQVYQ
jgi:hypothetical protein